MKLDLYALLGLKPGASPEEIKAAGRAAQRRSHPDAGGSAEEFISIQKALVVLQDPKKRANYDSTGNPEGGFSETAEYQGALSLFAQAFALQINQSSFDPARHDAIQGVKSNLKAAMRNFEQRLVTIARDQKRMAKVRKGLRRVDGKPGAGHLEEILIGRERDFARDIADTEGNLRLHKMALEMAEQYAYVPAPDGDEQPGRRATTLAEMLASGLLD